MIKRNNKIENKKLLIDKYVEHNLENKNKAINEFGIINVDEVIVDICEVCYWQYDKVSEEKPDEIIGSNRVSLNTARKNYKLFGASEECFKNIVRLPYKDEM